MADSPEQRTPEEQRAVEAQTAVIGLVGEAAIWGRPFPHNEVSEIIAGLDLDVRYRVEELLGDTFGDAFRRAAGAIALE